MDREKYVFPKSKHWFYLKLADVGDIVFSELTMVGNGLFYVNTSYHHVWGQKISEERRMKYSFYIAGDFVIREIPESDVL